MSKTDENKYRYWVFTWNETDEGALPTNIELKHLFEQVDNIDKYVFQLERGEANQREHFQGAFVTKIRVRQSTLLKCIRNFVEEKFPSLEVYNAVQQLTINRMCGTWEEAFNYCTKSDTAMSEPVMSSSLEVYKGEDVMFLSDPDKRYPWQQDLIDKILDQGEDSVKVADDRKIIWIWDPYGNSGKSKFIKYICLCHNNTAKIPFGTGSQIKGGIVSAGVRSLYFVDMTWTRAEDDSLPSLISNLEDLKGGFVTSVSYCKYASIMMAPPAIVVMSNEACPRSLAAADRWESYKIDPDKKTLEEESRWIDSFK